MPFNILSNWKNLSDEVIFNAKIFLEILVQSLKDRYVNLPFEKSYFLVFSGYMTLLHSH